MESNAAINIPAIPSIPCGGGFYAGRIAVGADTYNLFAAPKAEGTHADAPWNASRKSVGGACSYFDGHANTMAMAEAGSALAQWALDLRIGGHDDWYLPSQDELEILYRNLKPTTEKNYLYGRSGVNVSAVPSTYSYTADAPRQTPAEAFKAGGEQAFDPAWHWSSTQHTSNSDCAWGQYFYYGNQYYLYKSFECRARAVRRSKI